MDGGKGVRKGMKTDREINVMLSRLQIIQGLVRKHLKDRYAGSKLGMLWAVFNPLLIMCVISFVFTEILKTEVKNFPLLVLSGILPWFFFLNSASEVVAAARNNKVLLGEFILSPEMLPVSLVLSNLIRFLAGLIPLLPIFIIFNAQIIRNLFLLPILLCLYLFFALGISLILNVIALYIKDLPHVLDIGFMFLFWITPVFYTLDAVPAGYRWVIMLNPLTSYVNIFRLLLYQGSCPGIEEWIFAAALSMLSLICGLLLFKTKESDILKYR